MSVAIVVTSAVSSFAYTPSTEVGEKCEQYKEEVLNGNKNDYGEKIINIGGKYYFENSDGEILKYAGYSWKFVTYHGEYKYIYVNQDNSIIFNGFHNIDGITYHFTDGIMDDGFFTDNGNAYYAQKSGRVFEYKNYNYSWIYTDNGYIYLFQDNTIAFNNIYTIDGLDYYFNSEGKLLTDGFCRYYENEGIEYKIIIASPSGAIIKTDGWHCIDNMWFYIENTEIVRGWKELDGTSYYFDEQDGYLKTGLFSGLKKGTENEDFAYYYAYKNGAVATHGWIYEDLLYHYADENDEIIINSWQKIYGVDYYFDCNGVMAVGQKYVPPSDTRIGGIYVFDDTGRVLGCATGCSGWQLFDGNWYYTKEVGKTYTGWVDGLYYIKDSKMVTGLVYDCNNPDGSIYYCDKNGIFKTGWIYDNEEDNWYYANSSGELQRGWQYIDNTWYYFDMAMYKGMHYIKDENRWAEFAPWGAYISYLNNNTWHLTQDGEWYYITGEDTLCGTKNIGGVSYGFLNNKMVTNNCYYDNGCYRWADKYGVTDLGTGWRQDDSGSYYYLQNGTLLTGLCTIGGVEYYLSPEMADTVKKVYKDNTGNYEWMNFNSSGARIPLYDGWYRYNDGDDTVWLYIENGRIDKDFGLFDIGGVNYYFCNSRLAHGSVPINSLTDYYLFNQGILVRNSWLYANGGWYYANSYGRVLTGTHNIGGVTYHFNDTGKMI